MAKSDYLLRYQLIIRKLQKGNASFEEMSLFLKRNFELQGTKNGEISTRTFQRDRQEILSLYSINIEFDFKNKVYFIADEIPADSLRAIEAFEMFNALKLSEDFGHFIQIEKRKSAGLEHFYPTAIAIKKRNIINLTYQKFNSGNPAEHLVEPYALKEFKNRWYLIAYKIEVDSIAVFALDRITKLEVTKGRCKKQIPAWDVNNYFKDCFGVLKPNEESPQKVILSFTPEQGKFIKTLPLHNSQKIVVDNEKEFRIQLFIYLSYDFIMELRSHGEEVKVISPVKLIKMMYKSYSDTLKQYS